MSAEFLSRFDRLPFVENAPWWIFFNGTKVFVYDGEFGDVEASTIYFQFHGTSGGADYQVARDQQLQGKGPIPEGDYLVNLELDPTRRVTMDADGQTSQSTGIQQMLTKDNIVNLAWGRWRARLEKVKVTTSRDNFYLHDSYKGHSHGCIETESSLYYFLYSLHAQGYALIKVMVRYPTLNTRTNGGTKETPFMLPINIKSFINRYRPLPQGDPKKIGWMPWPIDKSYRFEPGFFRVTDYSLLKSKQPR